MGPDASSMTSESSSSDTGEDRNESAAEVSLAKASAKVVKSSKIFNGHLCDEALSSAMAELDMEHYDDGNDSSDGKNIMHRILGEGHPGLAYHADPVEDPYLNSNGKVIADGSDDSDSELEDLRLKDSDLLILSARNEDDLSHLDIWVYESPDDDGDGNIYVRQSIMLSNFPLSIAWMDFDPSTSRPSGNFCAIGTLDPVIELWDLDVIDAVEPVASLRSSCRRPERQADTIKRKGRIARSSRKKKKDGSDTTTLETGHEDAVLGLSWNSEFRNVLASSSADTTVKVWDVAVQKVTLTSNFHRDKVQSVAWNQTEPSVLLSGGFDRQVCLRDVRATDNTHLSWQLPADVESLAWSPHHATHFAVSMESGEVNIFDARIGSASSPLFRLQAHDKAATVVAFCPSAAELFLTASTDKKVKVWAQGSDGMPSLVAKEDLKVGAVFAAAFCKDAPTVLAAGGAKGEVAVWDIKLDERIEKFFSNERSIAQPSSQG